MQAKLTLSIDQQIIYAIKEYAADNKTTVSRLTENFFGFVTGSKSKKQHKTDIDRKKVISELKGIAKMDLPKDFNYKQFIRESRYQDYMNQSTCFRIIPLSKLIPA